MSKQRIRLVILVGMIAILSILTIQLFWIKKNIEFQETNIKIQNRQDSLSSRQFSDNVTVALKNVANLIARINNTPGDLYGNVKQQSSNYFTVELQDTLHPYLLEQLLKTEFYNHNIQEDFQYGIYDCWSDSIVYGNYIQFVEDSAFVTSSKNGEELNEKLQVKLNTDVHYFSVVFPNIENVTLETFPNDVTPWYYLFGIILMVLLFFAYSLNIIIKQKKLSEIKNDFINNMTHELKTPIATIRISSETLLNINAKTPEEKDEKLMRYAGIIYKENKRLEQQVERVLNIAKLDKKELNFKLTTFDLHELIEEASENLRFNQLDENGGTIDLNLQAQNSLVNADMVHITNVIYNLLDNATKYCDQTPHITISSHNNKNKVYVSFKDNGKGISRENQKYIFDKFYRVPTGNLHDVKGFGLGLYYVKTIIEELGGSIQLKSALGKGSEFIISYPIQTEHE
ncbi:MAG: HAMP domain-containing histidine kinase [Flavobacteriales bacterium]|nr:HAMP domain-containing histidine kinase [Flavobacteriales bacterium]